MVAESREMVRRDECVLGFLRSTGPSGPMEITREKVIDPPWVSRSLHRSAHSSPRRAPVTEAMMRKTARSGL